MTQTSSCRENPQLGYFKIETQVGNNTHLFGFNIIGNVSSIVDSSASVPAAYR